MRLQQAGKVTNVNPPSSVTSMNSSSSSFVASSNGAPFVSRAQESSPSGDRYAPSGGSRSSPCFCADAFGVQYFAKICFKHVSSYTSIVNKPQRARNGVAFAHLFRYSPVVI